MRVSCVRLFCVGALGLVLAVSVELAAQLPPSDHSPKVGEKAPEFSLLDRERNPVTLAGLLAERAEREAALGETQYLLLVFYRGYW